MSVPDRLRLDRIRAGLHTVLVGREIIILEQATSTNDVVADKAQAGAGEGLVVFAEHQTAGRGQRGKSWESSPGQGLWLSILLRPEIAVKDSPSLTRWAAETVCRTIAAVCALPAVVKQPNDVYVFGRKIAGVLVEMRAQPRAPHLAILGIGLNVNQTVTDFSSELRERVTSLATLTGRSHDRHDLAVALLTNLDQTYGDIARGRGRRPGK